MRIDVRNVSKRFQDFRALERVSLTVNDGELVALLGPSGSGKTTLLRCISGLDFPDAGEILFDGDDASSSHVRDRKVGFVFQHYALFRHMTVFENVAFGLRVKKRAERPTPDVIKERVSTLLRLVQIEQLGGRYPSQLSGGQRQRVALARALAIEPRVLLLDEPFGALDAKVRKELRRWLRRLHSDLKLTSVFVTHDQEEALELADRVVVMGAGRIEQVGTPTEVYDRPASPFVFEFLGNANRIPCMVENGHAILDGIPFARHTAPRIGDGPAIAFVRPHDLEIVSDVRALPATIRHVTAAGPVAKVEMALDGLQAMVEAEIPRSSEHLPDLVVGAKVNVVAREARVFSANAAPPPAAGPAA